MRNKCTRDDLINFPIMKAKYELEYPAYIPEKEAIAQLKLLGGNSMITIVLGVWCSDSRLQVSRFYKILDEIGFAKNQVTVICVDETKQAEDGLIDQLDITRVPTFIFTADNKEIGRITESPITTLENDIVRIFTKN